MIRAILYLVAAVLLISVVRAVVGVIVKGFAELLKPASNSSPSPPAPAGGELKKDPVCGTYVAAATSIKKTVGGQVFHFCSAGCRDKFQG